MTQYSPPHISYHEACTSLTITRAHTCVTYTPTYVYNVTYIPTYVYIVTNICYSTAHALILQSAHKLPYSLHVSSRTTCTSLSVQPAHLSRTTCTSHTVQPAHLSPYNLHISYRTTCTLTAIQPAHLVPCSLHISYYTGWWSHRIRRRSRGCGGQCPSVWHANSVTFTCRLSNSMLGTLGTGGSGG